MTRLALILAALALPAHAETCKSPSIARVAVAVPPSLVHAHMRCAPGLGACYAEGVTQLPADATSAVVCLTPTENKAAERRWK